MATGLPLTSVKVIPGCTDIDTDGDMGMIAVSVAAAAATLPLFNAPKLTDCTDVGCRDIVVSDDAEVVTCERVMNEELGPAAAATVDADVDGDDKIVLLLDPRLEAAPGAKPADIDGVVAATVEEDGDLEV